MNVQLFGDIDCKGWGLVGIFDLLDRVKKVFNLNRILHKISIRQDNIRWFILIDKDFVIFD